MKEFKMRHYQKEKKTNREYFSWMGLSFSSNRAFRKALHQKDKSYKNFKREHINIINSLSHSVNGGSRRQKYLASK